MAKGTTIRQVNGSAFFPQWVWENLDMAVGDEAEFEVEKKSKGLFVAFWKRAK